MKNPNGFRLAFLLICLALCSIHSNASAQSDTAAYPPQIRLMSGDGFAPFTNGSLHETFIWVTDLPPETSQVGFRFVDEQNRQIGNGQTVSGTNLTEAYWGPVFWRPKLPLSTRFQLTIHWGNDTVAVWNVPYGNLPDTMTLQSTLGPGPFISTQYPLNDSLTWTNPYQLNTLTLGNLPPRTTKVIFKFLGADSTVVDSIKIDAPPFHYLDSAQLPNKRMEHFPLSVRYILPVAYCEGGPIQGVHLLRKLIMIPRRPHLFFSGNGIDFKDSIPTTQHHQKNGQVLVVDSVKHGKATNRPYGGTTTAGHCSFDVLGDNYTLEAWIHPNVKNLRTAQAGEMTFMRGDSAWWVSLVKEGGDLKVMVYVILSKYELTYQDTCRIFIASLDTARFLDGFWHHVAFVRLEPTLQSASFFLDGEAIATTVDQEGCNRLGDHQKNTYAEQIKATPVLFGGCNALKDRNSFDRSFIDQMDEIRFWGRNLSREEIHAQMHRPVRQEYSLYGYWNFNDLNNRLNFFDDLSFFNNCGALYEGALLKEGDPMGAAMDSLFLVSSNRQTDSIRFAFYDTENNVTDSVTLATETGEARWVFDLATLPDVVNRLRVHEYYPEERDTGFVTDYKVRIIPSDPLATTRNGWSMCYHSAPEGGGAMETGNGHLYNAVTVTSLPDNTRKVILGLSAGGVESDTLSFTANSTPFHHSIALDGSSDYIQATEQTYLPHQYSLSLWFNSASSEGGCLAMFCNNLTGGGQTLMNPLLAMKKDGSLIYNVLKQDTMVTLHASSQYNDGAWHHVAMVMPPYGVGKAQLFVDGTLVDEKMVSGSLGSGGYWLFGRCFDTIPSAFRDTVSAYFKGSITEIALWNIRLDYNTINRTMYLSSLDTCSGLVTYYPLDEGKGTAIHDKKGSNDAILKGSSAKWFTDGRLTYVTWHRDMSGLNPAMYDFFARVFSPSTPDTGMVFWLGRFWVQDPLPGHHLSYHFSNGTGYFTVADSLINHVELWSDFQAPGGIHYYFRYFFLTPDSVVLQTETFQFDNSPFSCSFDLNTGLAPEGSFLEIILFYQDQDMNHVASMMYFPILIRPMVPPKVYGSFGPFLQAIAPGTMKTFNTYLIKTPVMNELHKVTARFYDSMGDPIGSQDAIQTNSTTWSVTYDMASLSPPFSAMKLEFYLPGETFPVAVFGPYDIAITRTRPLWFDFIEDSDFSDIGEDSTTVTFGITTPIEDQSSFDNAVHISIPDEVPLFGGLGCKLYAPEIVTRLEFDKQELQLSIPEGLNPEFKQTIIHLGLGKETALSFSFENEGFNEFELDSANNLFTTQNRSISASLSGRLKKIEEIAKAIKEILELAEAANPESVIVSPEFSLTTTESFMYSSRLHLMMDTVEKRNAWGSYGDLKVNAKEGTPENARSASYHFYAGSLGLSFEIGVNFLEGVASGVFCTDISLNLGYGHSYITVPETKTRAMKDFHIDLSGKFVIRELWGVFEQVLWGPKLFYSKRFWGDDLSDLFPGEKESDSAAPVPSGSSSPELAYEFIPVSPLIKTPLAYPQASIVQSPGYELFTWLERGNGSGERTLRSRFLNNETRRFSTKLTIHSNDHVMNNPVTAGFSDSTVLIAWSQSGMNSRALRGLEPERLYREFAETQEVWWAVFDLASDSILQMHMIGGTSTGLRSGLAEVHPCLAVLSPSLAMIVWQVADLNAKVSNLWYATLSNQGSQWVASLPQLLTEINGIESDLHLASPGENSAVVTCINTPGSDESGSRIISLVYQNNQWSELTTVYEDPACHINYLDMHFNGEMGAIIYTAYVTDSLASDYERLSLIPWDASSVAWDLENPIDLFADSIHHLQYPRISINSNGSTAIVTKREEFTLKSAGMKISQVDLFAGNLQDPGSPWHHIPANPYICDTTKQVAELSLSYIGNDTLMLLTQEYLMLASNAGYTPVNGMTWGDPYMNQVLRCFSIHQDSIIEDIPESEYNPGIQDPTGEEGHLQLHIYPNPSFSETTIGFLLPHQAHVQLELVDMKGHMTARIADQNLPAGAYTIRVNTAPLEPGTYIIKLIANQSVTTRRMVVIH